MVYMDCVNLIRQCVGHKILEPYEDDNVKDAVLVYREAGVNPEFPEGWYAEPVSDLAQELMADVAGQTALIIALAEKGVKFDKAFETRILPMLGKMAGGAG